MNFLWHIELHRDYHRFPALFPKNEGEAEEFALTRFPFGEQCERYERWRRKQPRRGSYHLHVYLSHFGDFIGAAKLPTDFFDFTVNILRRRHQAFLEYRGGEPVVLLAPGAAFRQDFSLDDYVREANETGKLIIIKPSATAGELSGLWVIPPELQKTFAQPIPDEFAQRFGGNDLPYWLALAAQTTGWLEYQDDRLENLVQEYQSADEPLPQVPIAGAPLASDYYPAWTRDQFIDWMAKRKFRFAKTMRWCPHEYIVLDQMSFEEQKEYLFAIDYLHRHTIIDQWYKRFQFAVIEDGYKYWHCGGIDLLNRTSDELKQRIFSEDGRL